MSPTKQQVVRVTTLPKDDFKHVMLGEANVPTLERGQVLVKVYLRPVNPTDIVRASQIDSDESGSNLPIFLGSEGVGTVVQLGSGTSGRLQEGQRVVSTYWNVSSWQQYIALPEERLVGVPDDISDEVAAQTLVGTLTAMGLVQKAGVPKGKYLLQTVAASAVARQVIQYAGSVGVKTINVVRRSEQIQELKDIGADEVIDSSKEDITTRVKEITGGEGAFSAIDAINGPTTGTVTASIRKGGTTLVFGVLSSNALSVQFTDLLTRTITSFIVYSWLLGHGDEGARNKFDEAFQLHRSGVLTYHRGKRFPLSEVRAAMAESLKPGRSSTQPKAFLEG